ncbi:integral membrane protein [Phlyctema vagabunda]|uniref:Integral membrane protein n=1 Tax=Phlyctema vagabunda TaxID=108571 RepID=A0ABR4PAQ3_9HELO
MLVAAVSAVVLSIIALLMVHEGSGLHIARLVAEPDKLIQIGKLTFGFQLAYNVSVYCAKLSILSFFLMFIPRNSNTRVGTWVIMWMVMIMLPIKLVVFGFQCTPLAKSWDRSIEGACINHEVFLYFVTAYHIITDVAIFVLPIKVLIRIKRTPREKVLLYSLFSVGIIAVVIGTIRLYALHLIFSTTDPIYNTTPIIVWSLVEAALGVLCGSIPAMKPMFSRSRISDTMTANLEYSTAFYELKRRPSGSTSSA